MSDCVLIISILIAFTVLTIFVWRWQRSSDVYIFNICIWINLHSWNSSFNYWQSTLLQFFLSIQFFSSFLWCLIVWMSENMDEEIIHTSLLKFPNKIFPFGHILHNNATTLSMLPWRLLKWYLWVFPLF